MQKQQQVRQKEEAIRRQKEQVLPPDSSMLHTLVLRLTTSGFVPGFLLLLLLCHRLALVPDMLELGFS